MSCPSTGAGTRFELEQAQAEVAGLTDDLAALTANESQARVKTQARTKDGDQDEVARTKAEIAAAEAQLGDAQWELDQTTTYAPADGTVVNLQLRVGQVAAALPMAPVMTFIENGQWVIALFQQNEVREVQPGQEAEIALKMYPGQIIKCKVDSVVWATAGRPGAGERQPAQHRADAAGAARGAAVSGRQGSVHRRRCALASARSTPTTPR